MKDNIIPIFFSIDDNYAPFLKIALCSITEHANKENNYKIYVLFSRLNDANKLDITKFLSNHSNFSVEFVDMNEHVSEISDALFTRDYYSKTTYYRLFIPRLFPQYNKALYIDSDIIVLDDIANLYNIDLGTNLIGATPDESVQIIPEFITYVEKYLGIKHEHYFNAGIILMNLDGLRKFEFEKKFVSLLKQIKFSVAQDQDYLNAICKDRVTYVPSVWDKMPFPNPNIKVEDLKLIHYNLTFKPWHYDGILYEDIFFKYADKVGLRDTINQIKENFSEEDKKADQLGGQRLIKMAGELAEIQDTYANLLKQGKIKF